MLSADTPVLMHQPTQYALLLLTYIVDAARNNDPDAYRDDLSRGGELLDEATVVTVLGHYSYEVLLPEERDRLMGWQMGVAMSSDSSVEGSA